MDTNTPPGPPPPPFLPPYPPRPPRAPRPPASHRRLRRDRDNGMLGGVAAGMAETYSLDVTLVRVLWVLAGVLWIGVPAYIVLWIALEPLDPTGARRPRDTGMLLGLVLVAIGIIVASNRLLPHGFRFDHFGGPLLLIGGGLAILFLRRRGDEPDVLAEPTTETHSEPTTETFTEHTADPSAEPPTEPTAESAAESPPESTVVPPSAWTQTAPWPTQPSARSLRRAARNERRAARPRSFLTPLTLSILLIGGGIASLLEATGALDVNLTVVLAIGTCIVGAALVTAAFYGRAHTLILVGLVLLAATAVSNSVDVPLRGGIGTRHYHPLTLAELRSPGEYRLGIGEMQLDLRDLPLAGRTRTVDAQVGIGHLSVSVPSSVRVEVVAHAGAGSTMLFGRQDGGMPQDEQRAVAGSGPGVLRLDLRVGAGQVEVRRFLPDGSETLLRGD